MKKLLFFLMIILTVFLVSCDFGLSSTDSIDNEGNKKTSITKGRSVKGGFDMKPFFDVTMKNIDANDVIIDEFKHLTVERYYNGQDGVITLNKNKGTLKYSIASVSIENKEYKNVTFSYEYKLNAASKNLIYLCPKNYRTVKVYANGQELSGRDFSSFAFYIPLYGFGEGRLEVSNHLVNKSMIKNGTYWAE